MSISPALRKFLSFDWLGGRRLEGAAHLATTVAVIVGVIAIFSQSRQSQAQVQLARELAITSSWQQHMARSMEYPEFAAGIANFSDVRPTAKEPNKRYKYIWYSENLIYSAEQIVQYAPSDLQWRNALIFEFRNQKGYLNSDEFLGCDGMNDDAISNCSRSKGSPKSSSFCTYIPQVRNLIRQAFEGDRFVSLRLSRAEKYCIWDQPLKVVGAMSDA